MSAAARARSAWPARALIAACALFSGACAASKPHDYGAYLQHMPRSILVLPPLDETPEVESTYGYLSTVTQPLAERGYYVFPVALVDRMMKDNGLPTAGEMHQVSPAKLREIFGADAVLYVKVTNWGTSYQVIDSSTTAAIEGRLVDLHSGAELWHGQATARNSSGGDSSGGLAGLLASALAHQIVSNVVDQTRDIARQANAQLFLSPRDGLLLGPYHPDYEKDQAERRKALAATGS